MTNNKQDTTLNDLALEMRNGFKEVNNTIDDLAGMVARGFKSVDVQLVDVRKELATKATKEDVQNVEYRIDNLENLIVKEHGTRIRRIERKLQIA